MTLLVIGNERKDLNHRQINHMHSEINFFQTFAVLSTTFKQSGKMLTDHAGR